MQMRYSWPGRGSAALLLFAGQLIAADSWQEESGHRWRTLAPMSGGEVGFQQLAGPEIGLQFTNVLGRERALLSQILPNGSGVAAGDVNGDGRCDLYFCGLDSDNRLFLNQGGWRFVDATQRAGVACQGIDATGAAFADVDGDTDLDLLVSSIGGGTQLFFNDGSGRFTRSSQGLNVGRGGTTLALADIDADGDLDLYLANYRADTYADRPRTRFSIRMINGQPEVAMIDGRPITSLDLTNRFRFKITMQGGRGRLSSDEQGEADYLFLNDGKGKFQAVSFLGGRFRDVGGQPLIRQPYDWGLTAAFRDLDQDGDPDLYVCNDFSSPDRIWLNDGVGSFQALDPLGLRQTSAASMAVDFADLDRDGRDEIFQVEMQSALHQRRLTQRNVMRAELAPAEDPMARPQYPRNMVQWNAGGQRYLEIAHYAGLDSTEWSWSPLFLDVDLDGYEDLLVGNGFERDNMNLDVIAEYERRQRDPQLSPEDILRLRRLFPRLATPNLAFRNQGNRRFEEVSAVWGFNAPTISQGLCLADLDNDGDLDVVVNNMNDAAALYRNAGTAPRISVRLNGRSPNTHGIGARIHVRGGGLPPQSQEIMCGGRYLSGDDALRVFAARQGAAPLELEVKWRSGAVSVVRDVKPGRLYEIDEAVSLRPRSAQAAEPILPWFEDASARLNHRHEDRPFDDRQRQPLLVRSLSRMGPGVTWADVNDDGWEDAVIGGGTGSRLGVRLNDGNGGFASFADFPANEHLAQESTTVLSPGAATGILISGANSYETPLGFLPGFRVQALEARTSETIQLPGNASPGALVLGDLDGDGDLDLVVGGRVIPGCYPQQTSSAIYRQNQRGRWELDAENTARLSEAGMVSGLLMADLDDDGLPELVMVCEWGPIRVFRNQDGRLTESTQTLGLASLTGRWNSVAAGDFDGDGLLDLVVGNWGQNTMFERYAASPLRLYHGDLDQDGLVEVLIESYFEPTLRKYVPASRLDVLSSALPFLLERFSSHQSFAQAGMDEVLGDFKPSVQILEAKTLESLVLLNRADHFERRPLPWLAQVAPLFGIAVGDIDGDGLADLCLGQNFFGVEMDVSRFDAGQGLWCRGDGRGGFTAVPGYKSGIVIPGEQRGVALGDYDADGRLDLLVGQHNADTRLYRNQRATPGLRIRLRGPDGNPSGIGAVLRLKRAGTLGPAYQVDGGSGHWSQSSAVVVLGPADGTEAIWVRWPGGRETMTEVGAREREVLVVCEGR